MYRRNAEKSFAHDVKAFLKDMSVKYGAQLFVISAYERVDNSVAIAKYCYFCFIYFSFLTDVCRFISECRVGDPFTEVFPDWKKNIWENWTLYVRNHFSAQDPFKY